MCSINIFSWVIILNFITTSTCYLKKIFFCFNLLFDIWLFLSFYSGVPEHKLIQLPDRSSFSLPQKPYVHFLLSFQSQKVRFGSSYPRLASTPGCPWSLSCGPAIAPSSLYLQTPNIFSFILAFECVPPCTNMFPWHCLLLSVELSLPFLSKSLRKVSIFIFFCSSCISSFFGAPSLCHAWGNVLGTQWCPFVVPRQRKTDRHHFVRFVPWWRRAQWAL